MGELASIRFQVSDLERAYTGVELRPHFLLEKLGLRGSGIGVFTGPCQVAREHLVDWEDRLATDPAHARIEARRMIHFLGEFFGMSLSEGVLTQRFLMALMAETLNGMQSAPTGGAGAAALTREGDDLFVAAGASRAGASERKKLSVSIVTASPVSVLLHVGINVDPAGAPVPAIGLEALGIDPQAFVSRLEQRFMAEWADIKWACTKVRPVV